MVSPRSGLTTLLFSYRLVATKRPGGHSVHSAHASRGGAKCCARKAGSEASARFEAHSSKGAAASPTMSMSRFYRISQEHGFGFSHYLYILGESMTLAVLYALHSDLTGMGDSFVWLGALSADQWVDFDRWTDAGPSVFGVRLSPRLLLNYLIANLITYPLYGAQLRFCLATYPLARRMLSSIRSFVPVKRARYSGRQIPKAPSASTAHKAGRLTQ
ncbi:hypothetical protein TRVL_03026 [Trypanosoma vivax]|uniref:Uncharacterized protein n=1 Tax=Trypanosoma vivax (strain Y486) TaxID=1055687 RepID=G0TVZ4_TRYVY|nr:hypothetical protein TRVL_03026 [Trypanosoma vivax]CCC48110.1 conserved hypothetical protein [Trypanosoma vivax Y486]